MTATVQIRLADFTDAEDANTVVQLLEGYALDPMGGAEPLSQYAKDNLARVMRETPGAFSVIGFVGADPVALANCFTGLSTFACKPLINLHDLVVTPGYRGQGVGQSMLAFVEAEARRRDCCKVTLEVLSGNQRARQAYERFGFIDYSLDDSTGHALLMQKYLKD